jgi:hypothetical protein
MDRRGFIFNALPLGTLVGLSCGGLLHAYPSQERADKNTDTHKFLADADMTFEAVFRFAFQNYYIPCLERLSGEIGREKLIEMVKRLISESVAKNRKEYVKNLPINDFAAFVAQGKARRNRFVEHVLTDEIIEETDTFEYTKITECLWAKTFREVNAQDIGYAAVCHPDFAITRAFNPKIKLVREKTLMQGDEFCDFKYYWEG